MDIRERDAPVRLAEVIGSLSLATDLAIGEPMEHALRRCLLAVHLGDTMGLPDRDLRQIYDLALLRSSGCHADSHQIGRRFGDEQDLARRYARTDFGRPAEAIEFVVGSMGRDRPPLRRALTVADGMIAGKQPWQTLLVAHCDVAQSIARELGLDAGVVQALDHVFERWDGKGIPGERRGESIAAAARIVAVAQDAEVFLRESDPAGARAMLRRRRQGALDPAAVDAFCRHSETLAKLLQPESVWEAFLQTEPGDPRWLTGDRLDHAARAISGFVDLKSPFMTGHSQGVAALAGAAARRHGCSAHDIRLVERAGYLHDLGRAAVSTTIWEKPGPLSLGDWERVRLHPYYTERILAKARGLAPIGKLAAQHHERQDGSGYFRGSSGADLAPLARVLAAADVYQAMTAARPHRPARTANEAALVLSAEVKAGRLDGGAVAAVLAAAGHPAQPERRAWPRGLTDREVEVVRLIAAGRSSRQIGEILGITEKTVGHHIAHIYDKIDASTRAAATFFAMQHGLL